MTLGKKSKCFMVFWDYMFKYQQLTILIPCKQGTDKLSFGANIRNEQGIYKYFNNIFTKLQYFKNV